MHGSTSTVGQAALLSSQQPPVATESTALAELRHSATDVCARKTPQVIPRRRPRTGSMCFDSLPLSLNLFSKVNINMSSHWQMATRSSLCEVTSLRIKLDARLSGPIHINCLDFVMACEDADRVAAKQALSVLSASLGPAVADAIAEVLPEAATVSIKTKDGVISEVPLDQAAQRTFVSGLWHERLINNAACEVRDVNWRTFGITKGKEQGMCLLQLAQSGAHAATGDNRRQGNVTSKTRRSTSSHTSSNIIQVGGSSRFLFSYGDFANIYLYIYH